MIIDERMSAFIDSLDSGNPAWLNEIEKFALETQVPIIRRSMQSLLKFHGCTAYTLEYATVPAIRRQAATYAAKHGYICCISDNIGLCLEK